MKVSFPINMSQTRNDPSVKSSGQEETEAAATFSTQVNKILEQKDEKEGIPDGNAQRHFYHRSSGEDSSGSVSKSNLSSRRPGVSDRKTGDAETKDESGTGSGDNPAVSKEGCSVPGNQPVEAIAVAGGSGTFRINLPGTDSSVSRTIREELSPPGLRAHDNDKGGQKVSEKGSTNFPSETVGEDLQGSSRESRIKGELNLFNAGQDDLEQDASEPGKLNPAKSGFVQESVKNRDAARKTDFSRMDVPSENEVSAKTTEKHTTPGGEKSESGSNPDAYATARATRHIGSPLQGASDKDTNAVKGFHSEIGQQVSASASRLSVSNEPMGGHTLKPVAVQSEEFFSHITGRIQFLIRDGGESVRIRLHPDEFGHMEIRAQSSSRGITIRISAEAGSVKSILENNLHALQQNLQDHGLKVDRIQVELQEFPDSQSAAWHFSKSGHSNSDHNDNGAHRDFDSNKYNPEDVSTDNPDAGFWTPDRRFHTIA